MTAVHLVDRSMDRGTRCNVPSSVALELTAWGEDVTCGSCRRISGLDRGVTHGPFPRFTSAEYCTRCGLSAVHWSGCTCTERQTRDGVVA